MCKIGDIIKIEKYIGDDGVEVSRHTFVVLDDEGGKIKGLLFDFVASPMSSIKDDTQREKVANDPNLLIINTNDQNGMPASDYEEGFVKLKLMYYFKKKDIDYKVLGSLNIETYLQVIKQLQEIDNNGNLEQVLTNLA